MAHFNFVISQNAKWGHAGFYIDCHRMTVRENILLQKSTGCHLFTFPTREGGSGEPPADGRPGVSPKENKTFGILYAIWCILTQSGGSYL